MATLISVLHILVRRLGHTWLILSYCCRISHFVWQKEFLVYFGYCWDLRQVALIAAMLLWWVGFSRKILRKTFSGKIDSSFVVSPFFSMLWEDVAKTVSSLTSTFLFRFPASETVKKQLAAVTMTYSPMTRFSNGTSFCCKRVQNTISFAGGKGQDLPSLLLVEWIVIWVQS